MNSASTESIVVLSGWVSNNFTGDHYLKGDCSVSLFSAMGEIDVAGYICGVVASEASLASAFG
jgi:hypothetical protein